MQSENNNQESYSKQSLNIYNNFNNTIIKNSTTKYIN